MKKSLSTPSFGGQCRYNVIKRNVSTEALSAMDISTENYPIVNITTDMEFIASKLPIQNVVGCTLQNFPSSILTISDVKNLALCMAEPCEVDGGEKINLPSQTRYAWLDKTLDQEDLKERYVNLYCRIRRRNKK